MFFADEFFGYFAVGILAAALGVTVTLLCGRLSKKSRRGHDNGRTGR